jgi:hypothetical protein
MVKFSIFRKGITRLLSYQNSRTIFSSTVKTQESKDLPIFPGTPVNHLQFDFPILANHGDQHAHPPGTDQGPGNHFLPCDESLNLLNAYLFSHENSNEDISRLKNILDLSHIIFEIGCGSGEAAYEIASKNPHTGVIAIDKYEWAVPVKAGSHYQKVALAWREKQLKIQHSLPNNLVVLRAEADMIRFFPDNCIDSVLMLNPEPKVCEAFLKFICENSWYKKIKPGPNQILVVPFSREMGVNACGGFECAYAEERPGDLVFLKAGPFQFRRGEKNHWGLDLTRVSAYSRNSTRNDVYICGNQFHTEPLSTWHKVIGKIF